MKTVTVTDKDGTSFSHGYVSPKDQDGNTIVNSGDRVKEGEPIGTVQDRAKHDASGKMENHIHFEVREKGRIVDPTPTFESWQGR